jgi:hypothetical protein
MINGTTKSHQIGGLKLTEEFPGCFKVENADDGVYEYFPGKPLYAVVEGKTYRLSPVDQPGPPRPEYPLP